MRDFPLTFEYRGGGVKVFYSPPLACPLGLLGSRPGTCQAQQGAHDGEGHGGHRKLQIWLGGSWQRVNATLGTQPWQQRGPDMAITLMCGSSPKELKVAETTSSPFVPKQNTGLSIELGGGGGAD